ncbi:MAG: ABC transporter substrate-binding protein [Nitrospirae bacterium]|nr:ABC transporter substrate-binding protein [Nitrospirota bacterium]
MKRSVMYLMILLMTLFLLSVSGSRADAERGFGRIVVLYAPVSPILKALGVEGEVVGVTRTDKVFSAATNVGSHLRPNIELIKALRPDLIIAGSRKAMPDEVVKGFNARVFRYDPRNLNEIVDHIKELGRLLGREKEAEKLTASLESKLHVIKPLSRPPKVVYEVMSQPLKVAGSRSIVTDIIESAGGRNIIEVKRKHVNISPEKILKNPPDIYIYQVGPMNKNPVPPDRRPYFRGLRARILKVDEYRFGRPGINAFDAAVELNRFFREVMM